MTYVKQQPPGGWPNEGIVNSTALTNMDNGIYTNSITSMNFIPKLLTTNYGILVSDNFTVFNVDTTFGAITLTLPIANTVNTGRFYWFNDIKDNFGGHSFTVQVNGGSTDNFFAQGVQFISGSITFSVQTNGVIYTDGVDNWYVLCFNQYFYKNQEVDYIASIINMDGNSTLTLPFNINQPNPGSYTPQLQCLVDIVSGGEINGTVSNSVVASAASAVTASIASGISSGVVGGISSGVVGGITLNAGSTDWVTFSAPRVHQIAVPIIPSQGGLTAGWVASTTDVIGIFGPANTSIQPLSLPVQHNGATLSSVAMFVKVSTHSGPPATFPSMQIKRRNLVSGISSDVFLSSTNQQYASGSWTSGTVTNWVYGCNQNNVIDTSQYLYFVELVDENGSGSASDNNFYGMLLTFGAINNNQFQ